MPADKGMLFLFYWKLLMPDGLEPEAEYCFHPGRKWRFDWAFPAAQIAVEVDGNAWHVAGGGRHMQDADLEKSNQAVLDNWRVFRFSPAMLETKPVECIELVRDALRRS